MLHFIVFWNWTSSYFLIYLSVQSTIKKNVKRRNLAFLFLRHDKGKILCSNRTRNVVTHMLQVFLQQKPLDESFPQSNHHTRQVYWLYMDAATEHFDALLNIFILKITKCGNEKLRFQLFKGLNTWHGKKILKKKKNLLGTFRNPHF